MGAFGFGERAGRFQNRWTGDGDGRLTDVFHLFEFGGEAFLEVGAFIFLEVICQKTKTCRGCDFCVNDPYFA